MNLDNIRIGTFLQAQAHFWAEKQTRNLDGEERQIAIEQLKHSKLQELILQKNREDIQSIPASVVMPNENTQDVLVKRYRLKNGADKQQAEKSVQDYGEKLSSVDFDGDFDNVEKILLTSFDVVLLPFKEAHVDKNLHHHPLDCLDEDIEEADSETQDVTDNSNPFSQGKIIIDGASLSNRLDELSISVGEFAVNMGVGESTINSWLSSVVPESRTQKVLDALA